MGLTGADLARLGPAAQKQILDKLSASATVKSDGNPAVKENKYHNQPVSVNGIRFDSRKEASRYVELMSLQKDGKIRNLRLQAQYTLQESYITPEGERIRAIRYVADFAYERLTQCNVLHTDGEGYEPSTNETRWLQVVEDVKSRATKTAQYEMKKKLLRERFNITITEV